MTSMIGASRRTLCFVIGTQLFEFYSLTSRETCVKVASDSIFAFPSSGRRCIIGGVDCIGPLFLFDLLMSRMIRTLVVAVVVSLTAVDLVFAQLSDSPWLNSSDISIPAGEKAQITVGPFGCPVVVVDREAWHIKSKKVVQTIPGDTEIGEYRCLSGNGMYFAAYEGTHWDKGSSINVWNLVTGELISRVPGKQSSYYPVMKIMYNRYLLAAPNTGQSLLIWDIQESKKVRDVLCRTENIEEGQLTVSPDGKFLALVEGDKVSVLNLADGRYVGNLAAPLRDPSSTYNYTLGASGVEDLEFSPDGQEMAAIYNTYGRQRLVVWNGRGQIIYDISMFIPWGRLNEYSLSWLPDKKGWIVDGNVIHRDSKKTTVQFKRPRYDTDEIGVLDQYFVIGRFGEDAESITMIGIPWEEVDRSFEAMESVENAILGPGVKVSLMVYMRGQTGETINKARAAIGDAIVARLKADKMLFAPDQEVYLRFNCEPASLEHSYGVAKLDLFIKGSDEPIWSHEFTSGSSRSFLQGLDGGTIADGATESLAREIALIQIPYFIPRTAEHLPLPLVIQ